MTANSQISPGVRRFILFVDRVSIYVGAHWLFLMNALLFIFVGLPILAPVLMYFGLTGPANVIYVVYHFNCHQLAYRSYFFLGDQPVSVYSLDQLVSQYHVPADDLVYWADFRGNATMGYKMAWCERDAAMYMTMLLAGIVFAFVRTRLKPLNWRIYVLMLVPMAIDGFWQLFTSPSYLFQFLPVHESNWWLRGITGVLFGIGSVWLIYPYIQDAMRDLSVQARAQWDRAREHA